eukprot:CCRYP_018119-RA/>CCRYP_018119-RA protein AED:0.46 eAED:0.46 QI:0/-1/0/1/-1/0/1/0/71
MKNVPVAFDILSDSVAPPADHQYIRCHMIFDFKMEDFRCKARLVAGGHVTRPQQPSLMPVSCLERPFRLLC